MLLIKSLILSWPPCCFSRTDSIQSAARSRTAVAHYVTHSVVVTLLLLSCTACVQSAAGRRTAIAYSLLQGGALLLLMARLVSQVSFQPQLSVIAGTFKGGAACNLVPMFTDLADLQVTDARGPNSPNCTQMLADLGPNP
eukprot:1161659-Pelagomonas_calceolata.AAC.7